MMMSLSKSEYKLRFYVDFLLDGCLSVLTSIFSSLVSPGTEVTSLKFPTLTILSKDGT